MGKGEIARKAGNQHFHLSPQCFQKVNPFPKDSFKLKVFADINFKFDENGKKFSKGIENTVGKGEIACYRQFLLFPHCFLRLILQAHKNQGLFGKGLKEVIMW